MNQIEAKIKNDITDKIQHLPLSKAAQAEAILRTIKNLKAEGKDETNMDMFECVMDLMKLLEENKK
jgi:hypothetical protein